MINYNEFTGEIVIEWHEKKDQKAAPIYHSFNRLPSMAQLHPKDPAKVIRAHFEGAMPSWMKDYAKAHDYKCNSTQLDGKFGWWIANWNAYKKGEKPFSAPTIKGAVRQLSQHIPNAYAEGRNGFLRTWITSLET
ncbi:hypothetical protein [Aneurinibacillus tyrosinisolvens]|uniref:hypothetical protein n=1 Tax=Aneurinibacillus tyrosinisolvens TaxID=1443435 RepID=UPI00063F5F99|nr:hypothetical protein [Aneurinibacillus tyrosinisolvens]